MKFCNDLINLSIIDDDVRILEKLEKQFSKDDKINLLWAGTDHINFNESFVKKTDILLLDLLLDDISGLNLIESLKDTNPSMDILIYSIVEDNDVLLSCIQKGVSGYLLKTISDVELRNVLTITYDGGAFLSPLMAKKMLNHLNSAKSIDQELSLNSFEFEILKLLSEGYSYKLIADKMNLTIDSVRYYIKGLYKKLQVNSKGEAISMYLRNHVV